MGVITYRLSHNPECTGAGRIAAVFGAAGGEPRPGTVMLGGTPAARGGVRLRIASNAG
jgi:hypothetical protein